MLWSKLPRLPRHKLNNLGVLLLLPECLSPSCASRQWLDCAGLFSRRGGISIVAAENGPMKRDYERSGIEVVPLQPSRGFFSKLWRKYRLEMLIKHVQPRQIWFERLEDLPLFNQVGANTIAQYVPSLPLTLPEHATPILSEFTSRGGLITVQSNYAAQLLHDNYAVAPESMRLLPPSINLAQFETARVPPERALKLADTWQLPENAIMILHLGPLRQGGGQERMIKMLAEWRRPDVYIVMLGVEMESGVRGQLVALADRLGVLNQLLFTDFCPDLPAAMWFAHAVVAAGDTPCDAMPELVAAQAMGRPLVVSDCGALPELVAAGETAWVVPAGDEAALQEALNEALNMSQIDRMHMAMRMQRWVESNFPYDRWQDDMLTLAA